MAKVDTIIVEYEADTRELKADIKDVNKAQASVAKTNKKVNDQVKKNNKGLSKSFSALGGVIAGAFAVEAIISALTSVTKSVAEFEKGLDNLSAITGATGKDLEFYRQTAIDVARDQKLATVSANEFVEALKLVGSARPELLQNKEALAALTKEAIILSQASGDDLVTSAMNLGNALNFMNLPAEESARVINVLAAASQKGSKEIPFINEALAKFGGIASSAGISIETSVAAVETLGKVMPEAATAGTNLRNIIAILQIEADKAGRPFAGLAGEIELLAPQVDNVTQLNKTFGRENLLAIQTLIKSRDEFGELTEAITGTETAYDQAATNTDNLSTNFTRFQNTLEAIILGEGGGFGEFLNALVVGATELIDNIDPVLDVFGELFDIFGELGSEIFGLLEDLDLVSDSTDKASGFMEIFATALRLVTFGTRTIARGLIEMVKFLRSVKDSIKPVTDSIVEFSSALLDRLAPALEFLGLKTKQAVGSQEELTKAVEEETAAVVEQDEVQKTQATNEAKRQKKTTELTKAEIRKRERARKKEADDAKRLEQLKLKAQNDIAKIAIAAIADDTQRRIAELNFRNEQELIKLQEQFDKELFSLTEFEKAKNDLITTNDRQVNEILAQQTLAAQETKDETKAEQDQKDLDAARRKEDAILEIQRTAGQLAINIIKLIGGKRSKAAKAAALFEIGINQAVAISELVKDVQKAGLTPFDKAVLFLTGLAQITSGILQAKNILSANPEPQGLAEGVIGLNGGVKGKDSIPAMLMPGESVMTTKETEKYRTHLEAMRSGNYDDLMNKLYLNPVLNSVAKKRRDHDDSFANNLAASMGYNFDDTNMLHASRTGNYQAKQHKDDIVKAIKGSGRDSWLQRQRSY